MKSVIEISQQELEDILGAVLEYNGHSAEEYEWIRYDPTEPNGKPSLAVRVSGKSVSLSVRVAEPLRGLSDALAAVRASYDSTSGHAGSNQSGGGSSGSSEGTG